MLSYGNHMYEPTEAVPWPEGRSHPAVPHSVADYHLIHEASRALEFFNCATATTGDPEVLAEVDLSKRIIKLNIQVNQRDWDYFSSTNWEERMADYGLEYEDLMLPFVRKYRQTALYQAAAMQCSSLADLGR